MTSVCLYLRVHQPFRLKAYSMKGSAQAFQHGDAEADQRSIDELADRCYLPANALIASLIRQFPDFKLSFSISGTAIDLFSRYRPDVLASFRELAATGHVEMLAETYYHSLASLYSRSEFRRQVTLHRDRTKDLFGLRPSVFRNTELIHSNSIGAEISDLGFRGILAEGVSRILQGRSPNQVYALPQRPETAILLRNATLSDDIAFRFDDINWDQFPLTAEKFAEWLQLHPGDTTVINLLLDYETFGIHKAASSGIFDFLGALPAAIQRHDNLQFSLPSTILTNAVTADQYDVPNPTSWEEDQQVPAWFEQVRQNNTLRKIYSLEKMVLGSASDQVLENWGHLQASDYFYYMAAESALAAAYQYHNPFSTPEEAFHNYTNIVADFEIGLIEKEIARRKKYFSRAAFINSFL